MENLRDLIESILSEMNARKAGKHVNEIALRIFEGQPGGLYDDPLIDPLPYEYIKKKVNSILAADVKKIIGGTFSKVSNPKTKKNKKGFYRLKFEKPHIPTGTTSPMIKIESTPKTKTVPIIPNDLPGEKIIPPHEPKDNLFIGKAGECAVMSELLFRGYNVNTMMVDDGVDIVASKNNLFYFIQVKTTTTDSDNRINTMIKANRFDAFIGTQIRYIVVARCNISGIDTNLYFTFNNNDIQKYLFQGFINGNNSNLKIKIRIDKVKNNRPMLYHENKETDITFHMNRFDL